MSQAAVNNVYFGPGPQQYKAIPYFGGGGAVHYYTPTFSGSTATLEVHALNDAGTELGNKTFTLSSTVQGAAFLGETAGAAEPSGGVNTFLTWLDSLIALGQGEPVGFVAYARGGPVFLGRGGIGPPVRTLQADGVLVSSQPETIGQGQALAWCLVAGSNGWDIRDAFGDLAPSDCQSSRLISASSTKSFLISAKAKMFYGATVFNIDAAPVYVKAYDKATAAASTDTPKDVIGSPVAATVANGSGSNSGPRSRGIPLDNGLSIRLVTGIADSDDTAVADAKVIVTVFWD